MSGHTSIVRCLGVLAIGSFVNLSGSAGLSRCSSLLVLLAAGWAVFDFALVAFWAADFSRVTSRYLSGLKEDGVSMSWFKRLRMSSVLSGLESPIRMFL